MVTTYATATTQYQAGWGGPIALLIPFLLVWLATTGYKRWREIHSPTTDQPALGTVKPQVSGDSDSNDSGASGGGGVVPLRAKSIEEFIAERLDRQSPSTIVKDARKRFKTSESTAWRTLRKVRKGGGAA